MKRPTKRVNSASKSTCVRKTKKISPLLAEAPLFPQQITGQKNSTGQHTPTPTNIQRFPSFNCSMDICNSFSFHNNPSTTKQVSQSFTTHPTPIVPHHHRHPTPAGRVCATHRPHFPAPPPCRAWPETVPLVHFCFPSLSALPSFK